MNSFPDTICAISTPVGRGAISVIRTTGKKSIELVDEVFQNKRDLTLVKGNSVVHGWIIDPETEEKVDEVLVSVFREPESYTGENMVEISTHGGTVVPGKVLNILIKTGMRMAERGEFTKRAFLNDKMSLLEAEALLNLIEAKTDRMAELAEKNLNGMLDSEISSIRKSLVHTVSLLEASLDFEDRDGLEINREEIKSNLKEIIKELKSLTTTYRGGKILTEGINIAIVGRTNVGKSSLFNMMLKEDRAIVTEEPGTTRDVIEGMIDIEGYPVRLKDMAGFRSPRNKPEQMGIERAKKMITNADGVIFVIDGSETIKQADREIFNNIEKKPFIVVVNKIDLEVNEKNKFFVKNPVFASAKNHTGIGELNRAIKKMVENLMPDSFSESAVCTTERQVEKIGSSLSLLKKAYTVLEKKEDVELAAFDVNEAIEKLDELTGKISSNDVLGHIFSNFCIGK